MDMKVIKRIFSFILIFVFAIGFYFYLEYREEEDYPLKDEWSEICKEFYRYYLINNRIPNDLAFLSRRSKEILEIHKEQFNWNATDKILEFTYRKPRKISLRRVTTTGSSLTPDTIRHNAQVYRDAGALF